MVDFNEQSVYEGALKLEDSDLINEIADLYRCGRQDVKQDYDRAIGLYQRAIELNNDASMVKLALMYLSGIGVTQDYNESKRLLELAVTCENSEAMCVGHPPGNLLGEIYYKGHAFKKDMNKAKEYFELGIKHGHSSAMNNLGVMYINGDGVKRDGSKGIKLLEASIKLGNSSAMSNLGNVYHYGIGVKIDLGKAKQLYYEASKLGNKDVECKLATLSTKERNFAQCSASCDKLYVENYELIDTFLSTIDLEQSKGLIKEYIKKQNEKDNLIVQLQSKIKYLEDEIVAIRYEPGGEGYLEAKEHFEQGL